MASECGEDAGETPYSRRPTAVPPSAPDPTLVNRGLYVVMGVAGAGKSLIGAAFARALDVTFVDGDDFHPASNVAKMAAGVPLTDEDRATWLEALGAKLAAAHDQQRGLVLACSAL